MSNSMNKRPNARLVYSTDPEPEAPAEPSIEEQPAGEHQVLPAEEDQQPVAEDPAEAEGSAPELPQPDGVHTTEEREAIVAVLQPCVRGLLAA